MVHANDVWTWINVFEPEYENLDCPQCHRRRIYFDREIGFYCMSCGQKLNLDEITMLIQKAERMSQPTHTPDKSETKPPMEIKEVPAPKAKDSEHARRDVAHHKKTGRNRNTLK